MDLKIIKRINYAGKMHSKIHNETIEFYTKKQMKTIYPNKNYIDLGEICAISGTKIGQVESLSGQVLPVYQEKTHNRLTEKTMGYIAVDEHSYLSVIKKVLLTRILILVLVLGLLGSGTIILVMNYDNWVDQSKVPDIDENAKDWKGVLPNDNKGTALGISIPGYKSINLIANTKEQVVSLVNPKQNTCYFVISLLLPDGTLIYESKMIPPSKGLYEITLNQEVAAGSYKKAIIKYDCYEMNDSLSKLNGANVEVILEVK